MNHELVSAVQASLGTRKNLSPLVPLSPAFGGISDVKRRGGNRKSNGSEIRRTEGEVDEVGDMVYRTDFRGIYSTILAKWLKANPAAVLGDTWPQLNFI